MALSSESMVEKNASLEMQIFVPSSKEGQDCWYLDCKHLLSLTFIREMDGHQQLPLFKLVQQPEIFGIDFVAFTSISKLRARSERVRRYIEHSMLQSKQLIVLQTDQGETKDVIEVIPLSIKAPEDYINKTMRKDKVTVYNMEEQVSDQNLCQLSMSERQDGWHGQHRQRSNGKYDKYYYHTKSNLMFRSLVEVNNFIKYGIIPKRSQKAKKITTEEDSVSLDSKNTPLKRKRTSLSPDNQSELKKGICFPSKEMQQTAEEFLNESYNNLVNFSDGNSKALRGNKKRRIEERVRKEEGERTTSSANWSSTSISAILEDELLINTPVNFNFDSF